jgi:hypothetical protein
MLLLIADPADLRSRLDARRSTRWRILPDDPSVPGGIGHTRREYPLRRALFMGVDEALERPGLRSWRAGQHHQQTCDVRPGAARLEE